MREREVQKEACGGVIREANEGDCRQIAKLYENSFPEHILVKWGVLSSDEKMKEQIKEENKKWIVFEKEGQIKGCCALEVSEWNKAAELERYVVDRNERGKGISTEMGKELVEIAEDIGVKYLFAHARGPEIGMQRSLQKLEFKVSGIMPVFYVNHEGREIRENFVYFERFINEGEKEVESYDNFIEPARKIKQIIDEQEGIRY